MLTGIDPRRAGVAYEVWLREPASIPWIETTRVGSHDEFGQALWSGSHTLAVAIDERDQTHALFACRQVDPRNKSARFYWIPLKSQRLCLAPAVGAAEAIDGAFRRFGLKTLLSDTIPPSEARGLGFELCGTLRRHRLTNGSHVDTEVFALAGNAWHGRHAEYTLPGADQLEGSLEWEDFVSAVAETAGTASLEDAGDVPLDQLGVSCTHLLRIVAWMERRVLTRPPMSLDYSGATLGSLFAGYLEVMGRLETLESWPGW